MKTRFVRLQLITTLQRTGEGTYSTVPFNVFKEKDYQEVRIVKFLPDEPSYPSPGAIQIEAVVSWDVFLTMDNAQSGSDAEGEPYEPFAIVEGSATDAHTGDKVDPSAV